MTVTNVGVLLLLGISKNRSSKLLFVFIDVIECRPIQSPGY